MKINLGKHNHKSIPGLNLEILTDKSVLLRGKAHELSHLAMVKRVTIIQRQYK